VALACETATFGSARAEPVIVEASNLHIHTV